MTSETALKSAIPKVQRSYSLMLETQLGSNVKLTNEHEDVDTYLGVVHFIYVIKLRRTILKYLI